MIGRVFFLFLLCLGILISCSNKKNEPCTDIFKVTRDFSHFGILKEKDGFVYVDVDDRYIHDLEKFVSQMGFEEPPYFGKKGLVGAHITVITAKEKAKYRIGKILQLGEEIPFTLTNCKIVSPPNWRGVEQVYILEVSSPILDNIRDSYNLPKIKFPFHITIGVKYSQQQAA